MVENKPDTFMGILMLDTAFPRPPGDIGNDATFPFPVRHRIVESAHPADIVRPDPSAWLPAFIAAARQLETDGAALITTSCGFLAPFQKALQEAVCVPVLTSALHLFRGIAATLPDAKRPGILTIDRQALSRQHLDAAGIPRDAIIRGMPLSSSFRRSILANMAELDHEKAQGEIVAEALAMQAGNPELGAILLECTNMPPHANAITMATGLPVHSINDGLVDLWHRRNAAKAGNGKP